MVTLLFDLHSRLGGEKGVYGRSAGGSLREEEMQNTGKRGRAAGLRDGRSDERASGAHAS
jgi:hypothetical protein